MTSSPIGWASVTTLILGTTLAVGIGRADPAGGDAPPARVAPTILAFEFDPLGETTSIETADIAPRAVPLGWDSVRAAEAPELPTMVRLVGSFGVAVDQTGPGPRIDGLAIAAGERLQFSANGELDPDGRTFAAQLRIRINF